MRGRTRCSRTTRSSPCTRRCSTSASSASAFPSPSPSRCSSPGACRTAGRSSSVAGRCSRGAHSRSASCSGAWWSYQVLGWGGFWGWDPVENAALLPWLTATAYIHSVIVQDRRGLFRVWNLSLAIATFALTDPRHVLHPLGRAAERARLLLEHAGSAAHRLLLRGRGARCGPARLAR